MTAPGDPLIALVDAVRAQAVDMLTRRTTTPGGPADMAQRMDHDTLVAGLRRAIQQDQDAIAAEQAQDDERENQAQPAPKVTAVPSVTLDERTAPATIPIDLDRIVDRTDDLEYAAEQRRAAAFTFAALADMKADDDADATLGDVDQLTRRTSTGILHVPLTTLTDADGMTTVLVEAVIGVSVDHDAVYAALDMGDLPTVRVISLARRAAPGSHRAIRALSALLQDGAGE